METEIEIKEKAIKFFIGNLLLIVNDIKVCNYKSIGENCDGCSKQQLNNSASFLALEQMAKAQEQEETPVKPKNPETTKTNKKKLSSAEKVEKLKGVTQKSTELLNKYNSKIKEMLSELQEDDNFNVGDLFSVVTAIRMGMK